MRKIETKGKVWKLCHMESRMFNSKMPTSFHQTTHILENVSKLLAITYFLECNLRNIWEVEKDALTFSDFNLISYARIFLSSSFSYTFWPDLGSIHTQISKYCDVCASDGRKAPNTGFLIEYTMTFASAR